MKTLFAFVISIMFVMPLAAQTLQVHPKPQSIKLLSPIDSEHASIQNISPKGDDNLVDAFCEALGSEIAKRGIKLRIGTIKDRAVKNYADKVKEVKGAYYIKVDSEVIVVGYDQTGVVYALNTLKQLLIANGILPYVEINDYPDVESRGVVEGFYGEPWSHEDRISLLNYFGENRLNVYIYGPKDDTFHSLPNWRKPYPKAEADKIAELVKISNKNQVDFVWAIHPGQDIKWNDTDRENIVKKFEMMYQLGVRSFAVFFDDISGIGTDPTRQAELLNYLHDNFIALKSDCKPLIMCPTEYNKGWSNPKPGSYLDILGDKLYPSIEVMWTGNSVISDITVEGMNYINKRLKRDAYIWWNFPVSDYVRDHLLLGRSYGLDTKAEGMMSGFVSNPMDKAESSKVAIYSIADYSWNISEYDSEQEWLDGMKDVMPKSYDAYKTFSIHNSDLGRNGHGYRREESVNVLGLVNDFYKTNSMSALEELKEEFAKIEKAPAIIRKINENPNLIDEISPWLDQFEKLGESGQLAISIYTSCTDMKISSTWAKLSQLFDIRDQQKVIDKSNNQNPYQPGIESGSLVMQPLVDTLTKRVVNKVTATLTGSSVGSSATLPMVISSTPQIKENPAQQVGAKLSISPVLETVSIEPNQYFGVKLPMVLNDAVVELNFNKDKPQDIFAAEVSVDGVNWTPIEMQVSGHNCRFNTPKEGISFIRVVSKSAKKEQFHMRKFHITSTQLDGENGNKFMALDGDIQSSFNLKSSAVLANGKSDVKTVMFLVSSKTPVAMDVYAIYGDKKEVKIGVVNNAFTRITIASGSRSNIEAFRIQTNTPVKVYEMILR